MIVISFPTPGVEQTFLKDVQEQFGPVDLYRTNTALTKTENGVGGESAVNLEKSGLEEVEKFSMDITLMNVSPK